MQTGTQPITSLPYPDLIHLGTFFAATSIDNEK
jgi:hypothetical protein